MDRDAMKEQAEGLQREYDRVCNLLKQAEVSFLALDFDFHVVLSRNLTQFFFLSDPLVCVIEGSIFQETVFLSYVTFFRKRVETRKKIDVVCINNELHSSGSVFFFIIVFNCL